MQGIIRSNGIIVNLFLLLKIIHANKIVKILKAINLNRNKLSLSAENAIPVIITTIIRIFFEFVLFKIR